MKKSSDNGGKLYLVANAHLDTQWNWTIEDTIRDCVKNTLERNFALFEKYPAYRMNFEGAFRYKLAKEYYPALYERLKGYIAEGRWNVAGSTWDAMDANVPSSEALMRQVLLGNGFFEAEFGKRSADIFLADCFGFRYALPSVAAHMGLSGFHTQKLVWGAGAPILHTDGSVSEPQPGGGNVRMDLGRWVGPDGNGVYVSLLEGNYTYNFNNGGNETPILERREYLRDIEHNRRYAGVSKRSMYYGTGDYGGSCSEESAKMVQEAVEQNGSESALFEVVSASTDQIFLELTEEEKAALPCYDGMLLIPHGYGAMTSHTVNKRWNRKAELLADTTERLCMMAHLRCGRPYPKEKIRDAWELLLWHQFHDDLPGTSIATAYEFSYNDYSLCFNLLASELRGAMQALTATLDTTGEGLALALFNPTSIARRDAVTFTLPGSAGKRYIALAPDGSRLPLTRDGDRFTVLPTLAPLSVSSLRLVEADGEALPLVKATPAGLENEQLTVSIDENGDISSIYDKIAGREVLASPVRLTVTEDHNTVWPSWEIDYRDLFRKPAYVCEVESVEALTGQAEGCVRITRKYGESRFTAEVRLAAGSRRVDVDYRVDWYERCSLLRAVFPLTVSNPKATFDQGLGAIESGNTTSYPYFQANVHQWADLSAPDHSYGVAILNDCKYGMEKPADNTLSLTLIHTPEGEYSSESAQDFQDMGRNEFCFSIFPHTGDRDTVAEEAWKLNVPVIPFATTAHPGDGKSFSLLTLEGEGLLLHCVKQEEKGTRLIVRVQETTGKANTGCLRFAYPIAAAEETNGYEETVGAAAFSGNTLPLQLGRYGVKTFAITLQTPAEADVSCYHPVALPYDRRTTSYQKDLTAGELRDGISIPAELWREEEQSGGVPYRMGPADAANAMVCRGQTLRLPEGCKKAHLLLCSVNGDKEAAPDCFERLGSWDQIPLGNTCRIKRTPVGRYYSHTHSPEGDRLYRFAYLFTKEWEAPEGEITLPDDGDILLFALTAEEGTATCTPLAPLYDEADGEEKPKHHLCAVGCRAGKGSEGDYPEGRPVLLHADLVGEDGIFKGFESEAPFSICEGTFAMLKMPDRDITVRAVYEPIGTDLLLGRPCLASGDMGARESGDKALTASTEEKWCAATGENHACWLEVTLPEQTVIGSYGVLHCGAFEGGQWNTRDFELQYRVGEGEWQTADRVTDNQEDLTRRSFPPVEASAVRLYITAPTQGRDDHCRIYRFMVFAAEKA